MAVLNPPRTLPGLGRAIVNYLLDARRSSTEDDLVAAFKPEGLKFNRRHEPVLTLDYSDCGLVRNLLPKRIAYTDERLNILSILQSLDNILAQRVSARVEHFSRYAVAW